MLDSKEFKKYKMTYTITLLVFVVIFLVLGILKMTGVITSKQPRKAIFNWITLVGGVWIIIDFIWTLLSNKRRDKNSMIDKSLNLVLPLYLIPFDLYALIKGIEDRTFSIFVAAAFFYIALDYGFQAIYHYFKPLPSMIDAYLEEQKAKEEEKNKGKEDAKEENKPE